MLVLVGIYDIREVTYWDVALFHECIFEGDRNITGEQ